MDLANPLPGLAAPQSAPQPVADLRPTADAAALARDPRPDTPVIAQFTLPPSPRQVAEVGRSLLTTAPEAADRNPQRVLKPFGLDMLPREPAEGRPPRERQGDRPDPAEGPDRAATPAGDGARTAPPRTPDDPGGLPPGDDAPPPAARNDLLPDPLEPRARPPETPPETAPGDTLVPPKAAESRAPAPPVGLG